MIARALLVVGTAALVAGFLFGVPWIPQTGFGAGEQYRLDLDVYRLGAQALLDGTPLYGPEFPVTALGEPLPFIYPPIAAVLFTPLTLVTMPVASILTTAASGILAVGIGAAVWRSQGRRIDPWWLLASVPVVLLLDPVRLTLLLGQVNLVLLAIVLLDVLGPHRRSRGVLIGLAAAVKLTPLVFVVWLVIQGDRRAAVRAAGTFVGATVAGLLIAPAESVRFWTDWIFRLDGMLAPENAGNQNLRAVIVRLGLPPYDTRMLWLLLAAAVLVAGTAVAVRATRAGEPLLGAMVLSVCALLASPISWSHHWVWALPALPLLVDLALRRRLAWPMWTAGTGLALFAIGPHWFLPREQHRELVWTWGQQAIGASSVMWGAVLVVTVAWWLYSSDPVTATRTGPRVAAATYRPRP